MGCNFCSFSKHTNYHYHFHFHIQHSTSQPSQQNTGQSWQKTPGNCCKKSLALKKDTASGGHNTIVWKYTGYCCNLHQLSPVPTKTAVQILQDSSHLCSLSQGIRALSSRLQRGPEPSSGSLPAPRFERMKSNLRPGPSNTCLGLGELCEPARLGILGSDRLKTSQDFVGEP